MRAAVLNSIPGRLDVEEVDALRKHLTVEERF